VRVTGVEDVTALVETVNAIDFEPAGIFTLAGTVALVALDDKAMAVPPVGASPLRVTVPVEDTPPTTDVGESVTPANDAGVRVREAVLVVEPRVPERVTAVEVATPEVVIVKVAEVAPAATVTFDAVSALELLEDKLT
jgi:hypothetical protein